MSDASKLIIVYEDDNILVIDKPASVVAHPSKGHHDGTVADLLSHKIANQQFDSSRAGIVHRLDKNTSGLMVVAKNTPASDNLMRQFQNRSVKKKYQALVHGEIKEDRGVIDLPVGRSVRERKTMSIFAPGAKSALTHYQVLKRYTNPRASFTLLELDLYTGRTHQIRTHLAAIGHPLVGDPEYGNAALDKRSGTALNRQWLHATNLEFNLIDGKRVAFSSNPGADLTKVLKNLSVL